MNSKLYGSRPQGDVRAQAARCLGALLKDSRSLGTLLPLALQQVSAKDKGLLQELCYGTLRYFPRLNLIAQKLLSTAIKPHESEVQALILLGLYQLDYLRTPDHAAISATVDAAKALKKDWAIKLVNGVLRTYLRSRTELQQQLSEQPVFQYAHPKWLIKTIQQAWPEQADDILAANNQHPPLTLRLAEQAPDAYCQQLQDINLEAQPTAYSPLGVTLSKACDVDQLPGFSEGKLSVQDEAAQFAARLLELAPGQRVLDACCAPGGKTGLILECEPALGQVLALDSEERRLKQVHDNLKRLKAKVPVTVLCGDACQLQSWWDGHHFDRILIDAPCSGTGVIRRHPDIKLLRKPADIAQLAELQLKILRALWPSLKPNGILVYATCSIMPEENTQVMERFIAEQQDAQELRFELPCGIAQTIGQQLFPQLPRDIDGRGLVGSHDGFYYARLRKRA